MVILATASVIFFFLGGPLFKHTFSYVKDGQVEVQEAVRHWGTLIEKKGPKNASAIIVKEIYSSNPEWRHSLAHTFGEALYRQGGISNAVYCGSDFILGCFHQFIAMATAEFGVSAAKTLAEECLRTHQKVAECGHGLGHALQAERGYTVDDLLAVLDTCREIMPDDESLGACASGSYMEYNIRRMLGEGNEAVRPVEMQSPQGPCMEVAPDVRKDCAFQLPLWWRVAIPNQGRESLQIYADMGTLCRNLPSQDLISSCVKGLGIPATWFEEFAPKKVADACASASKDGAEKLFCLSEAAQNFKRNNLSYKNICSALGLRGDEEAFCSTYVETPRHINLQKMLPETPRAR